MKKNLKSFFTHTFFYSKIGAIAKQERFICIFVAQNMNYAQPD